MSPSDVKRALLSKGFRETDRKDHWGLSYPETLVATKISRGSHGGIDSYLQGKMAHQLHITQHQFRELVECSMSGDEYRKALIKGGWLTL